MGELQKEVKGQKEVNGLGGTVERLDKMETEHKQVSTCINV